jgi:hypothetical protein
LALLGWEANEMSGSSSPTDRKAMLAQSFLLAQLSSDELDRLLAMAGERDFAGGQVIFQKGDPGTSMMAVLEGRVRISAYAASGPRPARLHPLSGAQPQDRDPPDRRVVRAGAAH